MSLPLLPLAAAAPPVPSLVADVAFYVLAFFTVVSAIKTAFTRNIVHAAIALFFTLVCVSGLYALLSAYLLAVVQLLVYAGGILMVVCFAVMLTSRIDNVWATTKALNQGVAAGLALLIGGLLLALVLALPFGQAADGVALVPAGQPHPLGRQLLTSHVVPFEVLSFVLLLALLGAVAIVRKEVKPAADAAAPAPAPGAPPAAPEDAP